jgi:hypothetical protein
MEKLLYLEVHPVKFEKHNNNENQINYPRNYVSCFPVCILILIV